LTYIIDVAIATNNCCYYLLNYFVIGHLFKSCYYLIESNLRASKLVDSDYPYCYIDSFVIEPRFCWLGNSC